MQSSGVPPLENIVIPAVVTAIVQLTVALGGWYASRHKDQTLIVSSEAQALRVEQTHIRDELRGDLDRERAWRVALGTEVQKLQEDNEVLRTSNERCDQEREKLAQRIRLLEQRGEGGSYG